MANGITFDTLAYAQMLQDAGVPQEQAKAIVKAQKAAFEQIVASQDYATKADMALLQTDIARLENMIGKLESKMDTRLAQLETRMTRWFTATTLTVIGVIVALAVGAATVLAPYLNILFKLGALVQN